MLELRLGTIAAYARYSSDKQNESSIEDQLRKLRDFAAVRGRQIAPLRIPGIVISEIAPL